MSRRNFPENRAEAEKKVVGCIDNLRKLEGKIAAGTERGVSGTEEETLLDTFATYLYYYLEDFGPDFDRDERDFAYKMRENLAEGNWDNLEKGLGIMSANGFETLANELNKEFTEISSTTNS